MIVFEDVSLVYPGASAPALDGVSLAVSPGERLAVVGANGSGKSTLARLANGLLAPTRGTVWVDSIDTCDEEQVFEVRSKVGLVLQNPDNQIVGTVVEDDIAFGPENLGILREELRKRVDEAIAIVGLVGLERREPHLLSEGQKQRLAIAGALAMRPEYLVLDEPTAMLDPAGRAAVLGVLERLAADGHGIIHITHDMSEAARADRVVALDRGAVAYAGDPGTLLADAELLGQLGLEVPPLSAAAAVLRTLGFSVPAAPTSEQLVEALWR